MSAIRKLGVATLLLLFVACKPPGGELAKSPGGLTGLGLPLDIAAAGNTLVAVGEHGRIGLSDDGVQWQYLQSPTSELLTAVSFVDGNKGYAVGHAQTILETTDGGKNWQFSLGKEESDVAEGESGTPLEPLFDVLAINEKVAIAVGAYGQILRTDNGGKNWNQVDLYAQQEGELAEIMGAGDVPLADSHYYGLVCVPDVQTCDRLIVVGEGGAMLQSRDLGNSWQQLQNQADITFFGVIGNGENLLAYGMFGQAMVSTDGGDTWQTVDIGSQRTLLSAVWLSNKRALLVGYDGVNRYVDFDTKNAKVSAGYERRDLITAVQNLGSDRALLGGSMGFVTMTLANK